MVKKAERGHVYLAKEEAECNGRIETSGMSYVKPAGRGRPHLLRVDQVQNSCGLRRGEGGGEVWRLRNIGAGGRGGLHATAKFLVEKSYYTGIT